MQKDIRELINKWGIIIFTSFWSLLLLSTYLAHNKFVSKALKTPHFMGGLFMMFIVYAIFLFLHADKKLSSFRKIILQKLSGWKILLLVIVSIITFFTMYGGDIKAFEESTNSYVLDFSFKLIYNSAFLILIFFSATILGRYLTKKLSSTIQDVSTINLLSLALGLVVFCLCFYFLAMFHLFTSMSVLVVLALPLGIFYKQTISFAKDIFINSLDIIEINPLGVFSFFLLIVFAAFNITTSFRPFPIGFDELSIYMNIPKSIADTHALLSGGQAYNWSLMMAVGYLFGGNVSLATLLSIVPGILAIGVVYKIARYYTTASYSALSAISFYMLPTFLWQSSADAKVDLALCFYVCISLLLLISSFMSIKDNEDFKLSSFFKNPWFVVVVLLAVFCAFSFGIKYTSFFFIIGAVVTFIYAYSKSFSLSLSAFLLSIASVFMLRLYEFSGIFFSDAKEPKILVMLTAVAAIAFFTLHIVKHKLKYLSIFYYLAIFFIVLSITFSPWIIKNYTETKSFAISKLLNGDNRQEPFIKVISKIRPLSSELAHSSASLVAQNSTDVSQFENKYNLSANTGAYEEVLRYLGYENGFVKYASVIYDMCTLKNVATIPTDIGLVCFILLPLLFINSNKEFLLQNLASILIVLFLLCLSLYTVFYTNTNISLVDYMQTLTKQNPDMNGLAKQIYLLLQPIALSLTNILKPLLVVFTKQNTFQSFLIILILVVLISIVNLKQIKTWKPIQQLLLLFVAISFILWWMLGNAISWYGLPLFGSAIILFVSLHIQDSSGTIDKQKSILSYIVLFVFILSLSLATLQRTSSMIASYEYDSKLNKIFLQYAGNSLDNSSAMSEVNAAIATAVDEMNANPTKKVIRIGTYVNYFIDNNNERVYEDNQLDNFIFLYNRSYGVKDVMNTTLKKAGVEYILFDLNTGGIDKTPDKSLTKKLQKFYEYISANPNLQLVVTDRQVEDPYSKTFAMISGVKTPVSNSIYGTRVLRPGSVVLFKIK